MGFVEDQLVETSEENGKSLLFGRAACDFDNFSRATDTDLFKKTG